MVSLMFCPCLQKDALGKDRPACGAQFLSLVLLCHNPACSILVAILTHLVGHESGMVLYVLAISGEV